MLPLRAAEDIDNIHTILKSLNMMFEEHEECNSSDGNGSQIGQQMIGVYDFRVHDTKTLCPTRHHLPGFISPSALYLKNNFPSNRYPPLIKTYPENSLPILILRKWKNSLSEEVSRFMVVQSEGLVTMFPQSNICVNITVDGAIRAYNKEMGISLAVNAEGNKAGMVHPMGCVYQDCDKIYLTTWDSKSFNWYAKIFQHGVNFTTDKSYLTLWSDSVGAGTRRTTDHKFRYLLYDFTEPILMDNSRIGREYIESCKSMIDSVRYGLLDNGDHKWIAQNIRVVNSTEGVKISRDKNSIQLKIAADGKTSISTPHVYCTSSNGYSKHLFVRKDEKRVHFDGQRFMVGEKLFCRV